MEVGAVKQAFNNEVILLKNNLKQAKVQVIHKLTRKAKTLTERKAPDSLKDKLKRKAELAVKEVLIIKKIKTRDIARFIITHEEQLNKYLNKPIIDENRACARLLLHKSMTNKYKLLRSRFANVSINDLLMSRQERRKIKKEARENQKNKKKKQNGVKADNVGGVWDVEMSDTSKLESKSNEIIDDSAPSDADIDSDNDLENDNHNIGYHDSNQTTDNDEEENNVIDDIAISDDNCSDDTQSVNTVSKKNNSNESIKTIASVKSLNHNKGTKVGNKNEAQSQKGKLLKKTDQCKEQMFEIENESESVVSDTKDNINDEDLSNDDNDQVSNYNLGIEQKVVPKKEGKNISNINKTDHIILSKTNNSKKNNKKVKDGNKNKNLNLKLVNRNFNKKSDEELNGQMSKIADPFFVTSTGENYMSLVEPRLPDEVKDVHREGNRQYRRAVMFGHVPKSKPRNTGYKSNSNFSQPSNYNENKPYNKNNSKPEFEKRKHKDTEIKDNKEETVPEKLHPSWEAKKRQSTIVPFKGKKIMFDDS